MPYTKQTWKNLPSKTTPINAERLNHMEQGIYDAQNTAENISVPTNTSQLNNDSGFITQADIPKNLSQLNNDSGFAKKSEVPTKTSELKNDSGFATRSEIPTKTSQLTNNSGFITSASFGQAGQVAVSDGKGGVTWVTLDLSGGAAGGGGNGGGSGGGGEQPKPGTKNIFVCCTAPANEQNVFYSEDALSWSKAVIPQYVRATSVNYGNGKFIASNYSSSYSSIISEDGKTFESDGGYGSGVNFIDAYGNGTFIGFEQNRGYLYISTGDGTWEYVSKYDWVGKRYAAYGNGIFVIVRKDAASYSTDGRSWIDVEMNGFEALGITYGNGVFVAIGENGTQYEMRKSEDGTQWETFYQTDAQLMYVTYGNGKFVVSCSFSKFVIAEVAESAFRCREVESSTDIMVASDYSRFSYGNGKFVLAGIQGHVYVSRDAENWEEAVISEAASLPIYSIAYGADGGYEH